VLQREREKEREVIAAIRTLYSAPMAMSAMMGFVRRARTPPKIACAGDRESDGQRQPQLLLRAAPSLTGASRASP
jgi:hypothetical protein